MCLLTFAYKSHPKYDLILAGNRDEFYKRPTRNAQFWTKENYPDILAGKDLEAGGTWLGVRNDGRWATLTNHRNPSVQKENPPTRGELVLNYLKLKTSATHYLKTISPAAEKYNGFNLLLWDRQGLYHFSNKTKRVSKLRSGVYGLSNALLDTPWPKVTQAKQKMSKIVESETIHKERIFDLLTDQQQAPDEDLPLTGIPKEAERAVSSIFIKTKNYGSRCSTILLIDKKGNIDFTERTYKPGTINIESEQHYQISPAVK